MWGQNNWNQQMQQQPNQWRMPTPSDGEFSTSFFFYLRFSYLNLCSIMTCNFVCDNCRIGYPCGRVGKAETCHGRSSPPANCAWCSPTATIWNWRCSVASAPTRPKTKPSFPTTWYFRRSAASFDGTAPNCPPYSSASPKTTLFLH